MSAYVIAEIEVTDPERYEEYKQLSTRSAAESGGEFVVRGGSAEALEGDAPARVVVIRFESVEAARAWYDSELYRRAREVRQSASNGRLLLVDGVG